MGTASVSCVAARPGNHREIISYNLIVIHRGVAQFGRALRSGRRGRRFKSCHLDHSSEMLSAPTIIPITEPAVVALQSVSNPFSTVMQTVLP